MNPSVFILYREIHWHGIWYKKVAGVYASEDNATEAAKKAIDTWDTKFGVSVQEWTLDDEPMPVIPVLSPSKQG